MIKDDELDNATSAGIVTQQQADALRQFVAKGSVRATTDRADDERFRFIRGFNDIFFSVGILLLGAGLSLFSGVFPGGNLVGLLLTWGLSELVIRRYRLVLPGILLACLFALFFVGLALMACFFVAKHFEWSVKIVPTLGPMAVLLGFAQLNQITLVIIGLASACAAAIFYARFRLPFALLLIAGGLIVSLQAELAYLGLLPDSTGQSLILMACGLGAFAVAMVYDFADRDRVMRFSDCAFWLHLLAAPLIVHSLIKLLAQGQNVVMIWLSMTLNTAWVIASIVLVLTIIALVIDRRALFVSALVYLGIAIGYTLTTAAAANAAEPYAISVVKAVFGTLVILGSLVLILGIAWQPLRRLIMRSLPSGLTDRLPRVAPA